MTNHLIPIHLPDKHSIILLSHGHIQSFTLDIIVSKHTCLLLHEFLHPSLRIFCLILVLPLCTFISCWTDCPIHDPQCSVDAGVVHNFNLHFYPTPCAGLQGTCGYPLIPKGCAWQGGYFGGVNISLDWRYIRAKVCFVFHTVLPQCEDTHQY